MPSVVAVPDGWAGQAGFFNVGVMWVVSSSATVAVARRVEAGTFGGWEQAVFMEELNAAAELPCCRDRAERRVQHREARAPYRYRA